MCECQGGCLCFSWDGVLKLFLVFPGLGAMRGVDALGVGQVLSLVFVNWSSHQSSRKGDGDGF